MDLGSKGWNAHVAFRGYLTADRGALPEYAEAKQGAVCIARG